MKEEFEVTKEVVRIHKSKKDRHLITNDQHKSSPISALSVIGVWQYERVQMSRTPFLF